METWIESVVSEFIIRHSCHTIILYGSRARGDFSSESDLDLIGIRENGEKSRDARMTEGVYLDAFIYPESDILDHEEEFLRLRGGKILCEKGQFATKLLRKIDEIYTKGPSDLSADEIQVRSIWIDKMLKRSMRGDVEGDYRRAWLLYGILEDYFALRKKWYLGPKESFQWLSSHDPETFALFKAALAPLAKRIDLESLVKRVLSVTN